MCLRSLYEFLELSSIYILFCTSFELSSSLIAKWIIAPSEIFSKIIDYSLYKFSIFMFTMNNVLNYFCIYKLQTNALNKQKNVSN